MTARKPVDMVAVREGWRRMAELLKRCPELTSPEAQARLGHNLHPKAKPGSANYRAHVNPKKGANRPSLPRLPEPGVAFPSAYAAVSGRTRASRSR